MGKYFCKLDSEGNFNIPTSLKKHLTSEMYITQGFDNNLWVISNNAFQEIYKKLSQLNLTDPLARLLFRLLLGAAIEVGLSEQETITLPTNLREFAQLESEILLVGQGDYFEIWAPELWEKQEEELRDAESNIERFSTFEITTR